MGWRPGQGVGPRVAPRVPRAPRPRVLGCELPPGHPSTAGPQPSSSSSEEEEDEEELRALREAGVTLAPRDVAPFLACPKADVFGLGYRPLDRRPVLSSAPPAHPVLLGAARGRPALSVAGQAFGVGALEEEDEDIYAREDMSQYDFALGGPAPASSASAPAAASANYLDNFCSGLRAAIKEFFPPPVLPRAFDPAKPRRTRRSRFDQPPDDKEEAQRLGRVGAPRALTVGDRAALVGDEEEERQKKKEEEGAEEKEEREQLRAAALRLTEGLPKGPPSAFAPFAGRPDKQRRYEQFLALRRAGHSEKLAHLQPLSMNEWERQREKAEFEQAARLFQPLSADMGERFVSASQPDDATDPLTPVEKLMGGTPEQRNAAKMKMFGGLTREEQPWQPCDLLCKRFNIAKPSLGSATANTGKRKKVSVFDFLKSAPHNTPQVKSEPPDTSSTPATAAETATAPVAASETASTTATAAASATASVTTSDAAAASETATAAASETATAAASETATAATSETAASSEATSATAPVAASTTASMTAPATAAVSVSTFAASEPREDASESAKPEKEPPFSQSMQPPEAQKENSRLVSEDFIFPEPAEKIDLFKAIFLSSSESEAEEEEDKESGGMKDSEPASKTQSAAESSHLVVSAPAETLSTVPDAPKRAPAAAARAKSGVFANLDLDALSRPAARSPPPPTKKDPEPPKQSTSSAALPSLDDSVYGPRLPTKPSTGATGRTLSSIVASPQQASLVCEWVESTPNRKKKKEKKKKEKKHKDKKSKSSKHKKHKHSKK